MGNYTWAAFRKNIDLDVLEALFHDVNRISFENKLVVARTYNSIRVADDDGVYWYEIVLSRKLQWKHGHGDFHWWRKNFIGHYVARNFAKCVIRDEGISETMEPDFDLKYPTAESWVQELAASIEQIRAMRHPTS